MDAPLTNSRFASTRGFSVLELLIVVSMISVLAGFALMQVAGARRVMARENAARQFAAFLEQARVDSLRRHPMSSGQMGQISLVNSTFYTVAIDADGDNILDPPRVISLPADSGLQFNGPLPRTIYFNWRGRTVDAAGAIAVPNFVTISSSPSNLSKIELTTAGQSSLHDPPVAAPVANSAAPAPDFRSDTQVP
jgi:prepilin-type N-terminal cleavage/methylation domain-containing protein